MKNPNVENFIEQLLKSFPKFIDEMKPDDLQPYMLFGDFGIYIRNLIDSGDCNDAEINKIFSFLNKMGECSDAGVHNVLAVGVLEIILDNKKATILAKQNLKGDALEDFNLIQKFWYEK